MSGIPLARYALCSASHAAMFPIVGTEEPRVEKKDKAGRGPRLNKSFFSRDFFVRRFLHSLTKVDGSFIGT